MLKQAITTLGLMVLMAMTWARGEDVNSTTTTTSLTNTSSPFVTIGSNEKNLTTSNSSEVETTPATIVHVMNAQARKIEMNKQLNSGVDVTASSSRTSTNNGSFAISTTMIAIIVALIAVAIVSVLVGTAVFVMRRRFSVWRLNSSKQNLDSVGGGSGAGSACDGGESGSTTGEEKTTTPSSSSAVSPGVIATATEAATETETTPANIAVEPPVETTDADAKESKPEQAVGNVSSNSLIVNVLNELSESVANKLEGDQHQQQQETTPMDAPETNTDVQAEDKIQQEKQNNE